MTHFAQFHLEGAGVRIPQYTRASFLLLAFLSAGCPGRHREIVLPASLSDQAVQERVAPLADAPCLAELPPSAGDEDSSVARELSLEAAIAFGLQNNPRLRVLQERVLAARAGEDIAFAPFLPQVDFAYRFAAYSERSLPTGSFVAGVFEGGEYAISLPEIGVHWTLCDFGRTAGRYGQSVTRTEIAELHVSRARQTVAFEIASAYFRLLLARAARRVREQALVQAEAILKDTRVRLEGGTADRNAVLRAEVEVSESREALVAVREQVFDAEARLNVALGQNVSLSVQVAEVVSEPPFDQSLEESLQQAIAQRREIDIARRVVAEALYGEQAARGEFLPRLYVRGSVTRIDSPGPLSGTVEAAGIHFDQNIYSGGKRLGELRRSEAVIRAGIANSRVILDNIALEVNLAYRAIASSRERIRLGEAAVAQARENLRLTLVKYKNSDATPTDVVDAQTALTRALMRYYSALYDYLAALAQLEYATGGDQTRLLERVSASPLERPATTAPK